MRDLGHGLVEGLCALRSAEDEQARRRFGRFGLDAEERGADRDAGNGGVVEVACRLWKVDGCGGDEAAHEAVGEAGCGVGFEGQGGDVEEDGGEHGGSAGVAADAEDDVRFDCAQELEAAGDASGEVCEGFGAGEEAYVFELADLDEVEGEIGLGDETGLHASCGADETDLGVVMIAEFAGDGECGDDVAAGAAAGDEDAEITHVRVGASLRSSTVDSQGVPKRSVTTA